MKSNILEASLDEKLFPQKTDPKIIKLETEDNINMKGFKKVPRSLNRTLISCNSQERVDNPKLLPRVSMEKRKSEELSVNTQSLECKICFNDHADVILYTCGHSGLCYKCSLKLWHKSSVCHICRQEIEKILKIDLSQ